jgi:hypothetical protein
VGISEVSCERRFCVKYHKYKLPKSLFVGYAFKYNEKCTGNADKSIAIILFKYFFQNTNTLHHSNDTRIYTLSGKTAIFWEF